MLPLLGPWPLGMATELPGTVSPADLVKIGSVAVDLSLSYPASAPPARASTRITLANLLPTP